MEERDKGDKNIFEDILAENFPNLGKKTDIEVHKAQTVPKKINLKRIASTHLKRKHLKRKLKAARYLCIRELP